MYKVTKTKTWIKDMQQHIDDMEKEGWTLVSHSHATDHLVVTYIWKK